MKTRREFLRTATGLGGAVALAAVFTDKGTALLSAFAKPDVNSGWNRVPEILARIPADSRQTISELTDSDHVRGMPLEVPAASFA